MTIHRLRGEGGFIATVCLGNESMTQHYTVLDAEALDILMGADFLNNNTHVKPLSLQPPYALHGHFGRGLPFVALELSQ